MKTGEGCARRQRLGIYPIGCREVIGVSSARPKKKGLIRCRECYKVYNEAIYPICPFCGTKFK